MIPEARRLVEEDGAQAIVGPLDPQQGMVLRQYARAAPGTAFLIQPIGCARADAVATPLRTSSASRLDAAQSVAGLGDYAYRRLGWRTAAVVADDVPYAWARRRGLRRGVLRARRPDRRRARGSRSARTRRLRLSRAPPRRDGVYLGPALSPMAGFLDAVCGAPPRPVAAIRLERRGRPARPDRDRPGRGASSSAAASRSSRRRRGRVCRVRSTKAFPAIPARGAINPTIVPYRDGVEALLEAFARAAAPTGAPLLEALAAAPARLPDWAGSISTRNRQAIGPNYLSRVAAARGASRIRTVRVVPDVEQTFGGYFTAGDPPPSETTPGLCEADAAAVGALIRP